MRNSPPNATTGNMVLRACLRNWLIAALTALCVAGFAAGASAQTKSPLRIVVLGDSLVAGFQLKLSDAFPAQLERALKARGHAVESHQCRSFWRYDGGRARTPGLGRAGAHGCRHSRARRQ